MINEVIVDQLTRLGARVLTADGADLTSADGDPTRTLIRQVLGAVAQFEKSVIVLKLRAARDRIRRRDGRCEGRKPFGSRPSEAAGAERIRQLRRKPKGKPRLSMAAIAEQLNLEGIPTRQGRPWDQVVFGEVRGRASTVGCPIAYPSSSLATFDGPPSGRVYVAREVSPCPCASLRPSLPSCSVPLALWMLIRLLAAVEILPP